MNSINDIPQITFLKKRKPELEFEIVTIKNLFSRSFKLDHRIDKPHRIEFHAVLYITKGNGVHHIDFHTYEYKTGSMLFISKGQVHKFDIQDEVDGFLILFTDNFLSKNMIHSDILSYSRLYNYHLHSPLFQPEDIGGDLFDIIFNAINREYNVDDDFAKEEILRLLLKLLLLKAERKKRTLAPAEKNSDWFLKLSVFRDKIEKHFIKTRNVKEYADLMNVSYKHINEICKSITGSTAKEFIDNFVILEIKRHLAISDDSVKEHTYKLGFDEPTNFVKFFKKHTGPTPTQFKQNLKK